MILTTEESKWVRDRMNIYDIKYQEIYDEVLDHILTAIETKRNEEDFRPASELFNEIVTKHFGSYDGIEGLAKSMEKMHLKSMRKSFLGNLKQTLNWRIVLAAVILIWASSAMSNSKPLHIIFGLSVFFLIFSPLVYAYVLITGKIKTIKGKTSLFKAHLVNQAAVPLMLFNVFVYVPNLFDQANGLDSFASIKSLSPVAMAVILIFLVTVNYSYVKTCRFLVEKKLSSLALNPEIG